MSIYKSVAALAAMFMMSAGFEANAQGSCVFMADDSTYYGTSSPSTEVYAYGPISFVWEPSTGRVLGGYYPERVVWYSPVFTYFNNITSGTIDSGEVGYSFDLSLSMSFSCSVPATDVFELTDARLTGTMGAARLTGYLDGPYYIEAGGTVTCQ